MSRGPTRDCQRGETVVYRLVTGDPESHPAKLALHLHGNKTPDKVLLEKESWAAARVSSVPPEGTQW